MVGRVSPSAACASRDGQADQREEEGQTAGEDRGGKNRERDSVLVM